MKGFWGFGALGPAERVDVAAHAVEQLLAGRAARRERPDLDEHQRDAIVRAREAACREAIEAVADGGVARLDVGEIERGRGLGVVEQRARRAADLPLAARLDAIAHLLEIVESDVERGVLLEEGALLGVADADRVDTPGRVRAHARREIVEEALAGREVLGRVRVDDDAEVLQAGHARARKLFERDDARGLPREQRLDPAVEVQVERRGAKRRGDGEEERDRPQDLPVTQGPDDEALRARGVLVAMVHVTPVRAPMRTVKSARAGAASSAEGLWRFGLGDGEAPRSRASARASRDQAEDGEAVRDADDRVDDPVVIEVDGRDAHERGIGAATARRASRRAPARSQMSAG